MPGNAAGEAENSPGTALAQTVVSIPACLVISVAYVFAVFGTAATVDAVYTMNQHQLDTTAAHS